MMNNTACRVILFLSIILCSLSVNAQSVNALFHTKNDPLAGNPKGKVTMVEFFDYTCGHCAAMAPVLAAVVKNNPDLRVVFKELPIRGPVSEFASRAALAAERQHQYVAFNHALLTSRQALTPELILRIAKRVGLNKAQLEKDMNSKAIRNQINANLSLAGALDVNGTPTFFIGKTNARSNKEVIMVMGEMSQSQLDDAIRQARG
jgi:protein-disulfide isomerase